MGNCCWPAAGGGVSAVNRWSEFRYADQPDMRSKANGSNVPPSVTLTRDGPTGDDYVSYNALQFDDVNDLIFYQFVTPERWDLQAIDFTVFFWFGFGNSVPETQNWSNAIFACNPGVDIYPNVNWDTFDIEQSIICDTNDRLYRIEFSQLPHDQNGSGLTGNMIVAGQLKRLSNISGSFGTSFVIGMKIEGGLS